MEEKIQPLTILQVSQELKIPKPTLRFWEKELNGVVVPLRTHGGQRHYTVQNLLVLEEIKRCRENGLSLPEKPVWDPVQEIVLHRRLALGADLPLWIGQGAGGKPFPGWFRKGNSIQKALDILSELRAALDFEKGGEIARNLDGLYSFWTQHVIKADRNKDTRSLDQVASLLEEIKSALEEAYFGHSENQTLSLRAGGPPLSRTRKAIPMIPKGVSR